MEDWNLVRLLRSMIVSVRTGSSSLSLVSALMIVPSFASISKTAPELGPPVAATPISSRITTLEKSSSAMSFVSSSEGV